MIDMVVHRHEMRATLIRLLDLLLNIHPKAEVVHMPEQVVIPPALDHADAGDEHVGDEPGHD